MDASYKMDVSYKTKASYKTDASYRVDALLKTDGCVLEEESVLQNGRVLQDGRVLHDGRVLQDGRTSAACGGACRGSRCSGVTGSPCRPRPSSAPRGGCATRSRPADRRPARLSAPATGPVQSSNAPFVNEKTNKQTDKFGLLQNFRVAGRSIVLGFITARSY